MRVINILTLDTHHECAVVDGVRIPLSVGQWDILLLLRNKGRILRTEEITAETGVESPKHCIQQLRAKLGADCIVTCHGGYYWNGEPC